MWRFCFILLLLSTVRAQQLCYTATTEEVLRGGEEYSVALWLCGERPVSTSVILRGAHPIAQIHQVLHPALHLITLKVPEVVDGENFSLILHGKELDSNLRFNTSMQLKLSDKFLSILVETSRPIYRASQTILFRVVVLDLNLEPYDDALTVFLMDPDDMIMRRWVSVYTNNGIASLKVKLPSLVKEGYWKIRIKAGSQIHQHRIKVENYYTPLFEVYVDLAEYTINSENNIQAIIYGKFLSEELVQGNVTVTVSLVSNSSNDTSLILQEKHFLKSDRVSVSVPMKERYTDDVILVEASITELMSGVTEQGFSKTWILATSVHLRFLGHSPASFKPSSPIHFYLSVGYNDKVGVESSSLEESEITLQIELRGSDGSRQTQQHVFSPRQPLQDVASLMADPQSVEDYLESGVVGFTFLPPEGVDDITVTASYAHPGYSDITAKQRFIRQLTRDSPYLSLWVPASRAVAGEFAVFHIFSSRWIPRFHYLIVSKGRIVLSGEEDMNGLARSFSLPVSRAMAPGFKIIVFSRVSGEIITDSLFLPVDAFNLFEMNLELNRGKDHRGKTVELIVSGDQGAYICSSSLRSPVHRMQAGNRITLSRLILSLAELQNFNSSNNKVVRRDRTGEEDEKTVFYKSWDSSFDSNQTFSSAGLLFATDAHIRSTQGICSEEQRSWLACFSSGCFPPHERCNARSYCSDGSDEFNCESSFEEDVDFKLHRMSRTSRLFDMEYGDWGWTEIPKNDHVGDEFQPVEPPHHTEDWYFTAFSISPTYGLSVITQAVLYSTDRPFLAYVSGPHACKRGEQVSLRVTLKNNGEIGEMVVVKLVGSDDYKFVHVEAGGYVSSYDARLSKGQHHILVYIERERETHIDIPIRATVDAGTIDVVFVASTMSDSVRLVHTIDVKREGGLVRRHTSLVLDLKNRAYSLNYLHIPVEETPIVPYQDWRRHVFGSPQATLTITGDVIGPVTENGGDEKCTESAVVEFSLRILTLRYLRFSNKITLDILKTTLHDCNLIYSRIMRRFLPSGAFYNWEQAQPSVWLSAWVLRALKLAIYADWENILYIDPRVFTASARWILGFQTADGSFTETDDFYPALAQNMRESGSLTAHVVIGLSSCVELLDTETRLNAVRAIAEAVRFLETHSPSSVHSLALVALALHQVPSAARQTIYNRLLHRLIRHGEMSYWSEVRIPTAPVRMQHQRPYLYGRKYTSGLTSAVESTSIALLVVLMREGVTPLAENVVLTLNTLRMTDSRFVSLVDTVWAVEALTEYANRARILDFTNMDVILRSGVDSTISRVLHLSNNTVFKHTRIQLDKVWGDVEIIGKGSGLGLVQLDVSYGVDYEPLKDSSDRETFELSIREFYSHHRNKSAITITACLRWLEEGRSGRAVLVTEMPSGYGLRESEALRYTAVNPLLYDVQVQPPYVRWFLHHVPNERHCFNHTVKRWYPVANLSLTREALLYDISARENFVQTLVNSTPLYVLNICEVCGSYQCPYCPFYSRSSLVLSSYIYVLLLLPHIYRYFF